MGAGSGVVQGLRGGLPKSIHSIVDGGGVERIAVDAAVTAIFDSAISHVDDSILIYGQDSGAVHRVVRTDTSGRPSIAVEDGLDVAQGATADVAVQSDTAGTLSAKLRGLNKAVGQETDAQVLGNTNGTLHARLRGISTILNDAWDDTANALRATQETHDEFNANANLQVGNLDVATGNRVPITPRHSTTALTDNASNTQSGPAADDGSRIFSPVYPYWFDDIGATWDKARGDSADGLLVNLGANNDINVTQLGGNAISLGAGVVAAGTQRVTHAADDPAVTALQIIDDWDEADRAKVNPIVGQAGIAGGSGASGATTTRVVAATDSPDVTSLQLMDDTIIADNAAFTDGTTKVAMAGYIFDEVAGTALTENDAAAARVDSKRAQVLVIEDATTRGRRALVTAAGELSVLATAQPGTDIGDVTVNNGAGAAAVNIQDGGNIITVDGTVAATQSGTWTVQQGTPPWTVEGAVVDGAALAGVNPVLMAGQDGANVRAMRTDTAGRLSVYPKATSAAMADGVANTHFFIQDEGGNFVRTIVRPELFNGSTWDRQPGNNSGAFVQGPAAHDAVIANAGNPHLMGANALAHGSDPTAVAAGDLTRLQANRDGILWVIAGHPNAKTIRVNRDAAAGSTSIVAAAAGKKIVVTKVTVTYDIDSTDGAGYRVGFGAASAATGAGCLSSHPKFVPGGGVQEGNGGAPLGISADNEALWLTTLHDTSSATGMDATVTYYEIES